MADDFYTQEIIDRVVHYAIMAARASQRGERSIPLGTGAAVQELLLREGGYCARFVRQVYETACGFGPFRWRYRGTSALEMCHKLAAAGHQVPGPEVLPGDILGINRNAGRYGHVGIYVGLVDGVQTVAENTSSALRGNPLRPGTKLTPYADVAHRVTCVYRLLRESKRQCWPDFRAFVYEGDQCREIVLLPNGDHRATQGKTYWRFG